MYQQNGALAVMGTHRSSLLAREVDMFDDLGRRREPGERGGDNHDRSSPQQRGIGVLQPMIPSAAELSLGGFRHRSLLSAE